MRRATPFLAIAALAMATLPVSAQTITIGTSASYPPIIVHNGSPPVSGLEGELLGVICTEAGWTCIWEILPFDVLIPALEAGRIDIAANSLGYTADRAARVHMTCPYRASPNGKASGRFLVLDPATTPQNGPIAVLRGSLHADTLAQEGLTARPFSEDADALAAVASGAIPSYYGPDAIADLFADAFGLTSAGTMPIASNGTSLAVTPTRPDIAAEVDAQLAALSSRGLITSITTRWVGQGDDDPISRCENDPITS